MSPKILINGHCDIPVLSSSSAKPSSSSIASSSSLASSSSSIVSSSSVTPVKVCEASVFGKVYLDNNNNGFQDANEPDGNIPAGVSVGGSFVGEQGTISPTLFNSDGVYEFTNLPCNKSFKVTILNTSSYTITQTVEFGEGTGSNPTIVVVGNIFNKGYDAGKDGLYKAPVVVSSSSIKPVSSSVLSSSSSTVTSSSPTPIPVCRIVGKVYLDPNKNGIQDGNEPNGSLPNGINVVLAKDGNPILTAFPDSNGNYSFENIPCNAGIHTVTIVAPVGYTISNSLETADGTGPNPTTININSTTPKTFDVGKDGIFLNVVICFNGFVNENNVCICPSSKILINGTCFDFCANGAVNPPFCTICPFGKVLINFICLTPALSSSTSSLLISSSSRSSSTISSSVVSSSVISSSSSISSSSLSSSSSSTTPTVNNYYYTYNNPTNTNTFNPVNTFTPSVVNTPNNSVVVNTPAPTIYSAPAPAVVYTSTEKVVNTTSPVKTVFASEFSTVRTGGMNYIVAFLIAISALIIGVIVSNKNSKFNFKLNEWNGSTTSNL